MLVFECVPLVWFYWPRQEDQPTAPVGAVRLVRLWSFQRTDKLLVFFLWTWWMSVIDFLYIVISNKARTLVLGSDMPEAKIDVSLLETPPKGAKDGIFQGPIWGLEVGHCWCAWLKIWKLFCQKSNYFELLVLVDSWLVLFWKMRSPTTVGKSST